jgi:hypothetical protein
MKEVPMPVVEKVWGKMNRMTRPASDKLLEQMGREQPELLTYLGAVDEDSLNDSERGILVFLGMVIWQSMKKAGGRLPKISEEAMAQAESATVKSLETLTQQREDGSDSIIELIEACGQGELMGLALDALMVAAGLNGDGVETAGTEPAADDEDAGVIVRPENVSLLMLNLKTVVDVLNV